MKQNKDKERKKSSVHHPSCIIISQLVSFFVTISHKCEESFQKFLLLIDLD